MHQLADYPRFAGVATNQTMRAEEKDVAWSGDRHCAGQRLERTRLEAAGFVAQQNVVDLRGSKARDLNRRIDDNQVLELNSQGVEIPLPLLGETVDRKPQHPQFVATE